MQTIPETMVILESHVNLSFYTVSKYARNHAVSSLYTEDEGKFQIIFFVEYLNST